MPRESHITLCMYQKHSETILFQARYQNSKAAGSRLQVRQQRKPCLLYPTTAPLIVLPHGVEPSKKTLSRKEGLCESFCNLKLGGGLLPKKGLSWWWCPINGIPSPLVKLDKYQIRVFPVPGEVLLGVGSPQVFHHSCQRILTIDLAVLAYFRGQSFFFCCTYNLMLDFFKSSFYRVCIFPILMWELP